MGVAKRRFGVGTGLVLVALGLAIAAIAVNTASEPPQRLEAHGVEITGLRTVLVAEGGEGAVSVPGQPLRTVRMDGSVPAAQMMATVLSDENCAPDAAGISHCTNRLRLDDGSELTVMHPHRMAEVPCLSPGERVVVASA